MPPPQLVSFDEVWRSGRSARIGMILFAACVANIAACMIVAALLEGDALNGKVENGCYFLGEHGHYTEVSRAVYTYSRIHALSMIAFLPIGLVGFALFFAAQFRVRREAI